MFATRVLPLLLSGLLFAGKSAAQRSVAQLTDSITQAMQLAYEQHGRMTPVQLIQFRSIDSLLHTLSRADSIALADNWEGRAIYWRDQHDQLKVLAALDSSIAYVPDTPANANRILYTRVKRLNTAFAADLLVNPYRELQRLAPLVTRDSVYPPLQLATTLLVLGELSIYLGYRAEGLRHLDAASRSLPRAPPGRKRRYYELQLPYYYYTAHLFGTDKAKRLPYYDELTARAAARELFPNEQRLLQLLRTREMNHLMGQKTRSTADTERLESILLVAERSLLGDGGKGGNLDRQVRRIRSLLALERSDYAEAERLNTTLLTAAGRQDASAHTYYADRVRILTAQNRFGEALPYVDTFMRVQHFAAAPLRADYSNFSPGRAGSRGDFIVLVAEQLMRSDQAAHRELADRLLRLTIAKTYDAYDEVRSSPAARRAYEPALWNRLQLHRHTDSFARVAEETLETIEDLEGRPAWQRYAVSRNLVAAPLPDSTRRRKVQLAAAVARARAARDTMALYAASRAQRLFENTLAQRYPAYRQQYQRADIAAVRARLPAGTQVLYYHYLHDRLLRFHLTADKLTLDTVANLETVEALLRQDPHGEATLERLAAALLPADLGQQQRLLIVPDGPLFQLPFEALRTDGEYLVTTHQISYLPFLSFLDTGTSSAYTGTNLLAIAPRYAAAAPPQALALRDAPVALAGAARESARLVELFGGHLVTTVETAKSAFLEQGPDAMLLHLAMHARIDNEQPELSYFDFGGDSLAGGRLYVEELYGLQLRADLAVLSACNTGRGALDETEGMISLHRAFTYAGVPATVASLWAVPDAATAQVMTSFYERLRAGEAKDAALRGAKLDYLAATSEPALRAPLYWAGFVLYGDTAPVSGTGSWWPGGALLAGLGVLFVGALARRRRRRTTATR